MSLLWPLNFKVAWDFSGGQWLRIRLPMQETWVQFLVQEDSTCRRAAKPCATTSEPALENSSCSPQLAKALTKQ